MESFADGICNLIGFYLVLGSMLGIYIAPLVHRPGPRSSPFAMDRPFELGRRLDRRRLDHRPGVVSDSNTPASSDHADRQPCT
jgi:hypothetical protein